MAQHPEAHAREAALLRAEVALTQVSTRRDALWSVLEPKLAQAVPVNLTGFFPNVLLVKYVHVYNAQQNLIRLRNSENGQVALDAANSQSAAEWAVSVSSWHVNTKGPAFAAFCHDVLIPYVQCKSRAIQLAAEKRAARSEIARHDEHMRAEGARLSILAGLAAPLLPLPTFPDVPIEAPPNTSLAALLAPGAEAAAARLAAAPPTPTTHFGAGMPTLDELASSLASKVLTPSTGERQPRPQPMELVSPAQPLSFEPTAPQAAVQPVDIEAGEAVPMDEVRPPRDERSFSCALALCTRECPLAPTRMHAPARGWRAQVPAQDAPPFDLLHGLLSVHHNSLSLYAFHALLTTSNAGKNVCVTPAAIPEMQHALVALSTDVLSVEAKPYEERVAMLRYAGVLFETLLLLGDLPPAGEFFIVPALTTLRQWGKATPRVPDTHFANLRRLYFEELAFAKGKPAPATPDAVAREKERQLNTLRFYAESLQYDTTGRTLDQLLALPRLKGIKLHANPHVESALEASTQRLHELTWGRTDTNAKMRMLCTRTHCITPSTARLLLARRPMPPLAQPPRHPRYPLPRAQGTRSPRARRARYSRSSPRSRPSRASCSRRWRRSDCSRTACARNKSAMTS